MSYVPITYPLKVTYSGGSAYDMTNADDVVVVSTNGRVNMHDATYATYKPFYIHNYSGGLVTVYPGPGGLIDFASSIALTKGHSSIVLIPIGGPNWFIFAAHMYP